MRLNLKQQKSQTAAEVFPDKATAKADLRISDPTAIRRHYSKMPPLNLKSDAGDLCYRTSRWQKLLWSEFAEEMADGDVLSRADNPSIATWDRFEREAFARLYSENTAAIDASERAPESAWAEKAHSAAQDLPEWKALAERVRGDQVWSGMAALAVAEEVKNSLPVPVPPEAAEDAEKLRREIEGLEQFAQQMVGNGGGKGNGKKNSKAAPGTATGELAEAISTAKAKLAKTEKAMQEWADKIDESDMRQAMRRAVEKAGKVVDEAQEASDAFGYGDQAGTAGKSGTARERAALLSRIRDSEKLSNIMKQAGRLRRIAARKQREKTKHAPDEIFDLEMGNDLSRVLPAEFGRLRHPLTRKLFLRDFAESRLQQYRLDGKVETGRGPIIVAIDDSGSMRGSKEIWAKAIALAMLEVAVRQKRPFAIVHWDTTVGMYRYFKAGAVSPEDLLEAMDFFSNGGTDLNAPTAMALDLLGLEPGLKKADLILVSDGDANRDGAVEYREKAKAVGMTTYGVLISTRERDRAILGTWCDSVTAISDVASDEKVHEAVFTI